jgi:NADP-dependent 3-hydroxy acid dehydrogenase YdfG
VRLKGSVVAITGVSSGIGEATSLAFAKKGARLELCARRLERLDAVAEKCRDAGSPEVHVRVVDVGEANQARAFIAAALHDYQRLDILVNNAGVGWFGPLHEMSEEKVDEMIATNLKGVINITQAALPWMLERHRGVIINVASVAGFRPSPYGAVYGATKHAVVGLSHALNGELSGTGVKVCVVYPYVTGGTEFFDQGGQAIGPRYPASWVANLIVRTARFPRRDAMVFPLRAVSLLEPVVGGLLDHVIARMRRRVSRQASDTQRPE